MSIVKLMQIQELITDEPKLHAWFSIAIERCREGDDFAAVFGLVGSSAESAAKDALLRAAECIDPDRRVSQNRLAEDLATEIRRFESRVWPRARSYTNPDSLPPLDRALWEAMMIYFKIPRSARRLFELLTVRGWHRQKFSMNDVCISTNQDKKHHA